MSEPTPPSPAPAPPAGPDPSCPLCGQSAPSESLHERAARLIARQEEVLQKLENPRPRRWWELMPVVVGALGLVFTILYQTNEVLDRRAERERTEEARRLELMSKFFPHLVGTDSAAQRGAVLALDLLADSTLAAAAVLVAPSRAAATALHEVRMNPISVDDAGYVSSVMRRLPPLTPVVYPGTVGPADTAAAP